MTTFVQIVFISWIFNGYFKKNKPKALNCAKLSDHFASKVHQIIKIGLMLNDLFTVVTLRYMSYIV